MIREYAEIFCWKNVSSFCSAKATHIFSAKNIRILYIESTKTVNKMTLNELVKLTMLWTTGPWYSTSSQTLRAPSKYWNLLQLNEPGHDKTYNKTCVTSKDSDQHVYPPRLARVLVYPSLKAVESTWSVKTLIRLHRCAGWSVFAGDDDDELGDNCFQIWHLGR